MMSPLVTLNRRSSVISHREDVMGRSGKLSRIGTVAFFILRWPPNGTARVADAGRRLVARHHFIDAIQISWVVLALGLRFADKSGCHQLVVALAVIAFVRLQLDIVGQLEILQGASEFDGVDSLLA